MNEKEQLTLKMQEVFFAMTDLGLYLDSHPDNAAALSDHARLQKEYEEMKNVYEERFGPLTAGGARNADYWDWTAGPMPWEV